VTIDPFGSRQFTGYVAEIGQVTAAELTGNAMFFNTGGTFTRVTHLIPVRVNIVDDVNLDSFIGVNARVRISLRQPTEGLTTVARNSPPARLAENFNGVSARGTVESVQRRNVYSTLGFMVDRVYVEAGERVANGQVLGVLDTEDLRIQLLNAQATLRMAEIGVATAEHNYGTVRTLYGTGAIPRNDLIQSEFAFQAATAARQQAQALVDSTRVALERSVLRSPINGTVTAVIAREGSVGMGLMFVVEDTDNLRVMTSFREYDLGRLATGMEVSITPIAAGSAGYAGVISRINPAAMAHSPVVEFEAEVLVTSVDTSLRIGMNTMLNVAVD
jgi:RND family efflux transporter MFP subunit